MPDDRHYERAPDAIGLLALAVVAGVVQIATGSYPEAVTGLVHGMWPAAWALSLAIAGGVALLGIAWRAPVTGRLIELAGRAGVTVTAAAYTAALIVVAEPGDALVVAFTAALALASVWRVVQLAWRLRTWLTAVRKATR